VFELLLFTFIFACFLDILFHILLLYCLLVLIGLLRIQSQNSFLKILDLEKGGTFLRQTFVRGRPHIGLDL